MAGPTLEHQPESSEASARRTVPQRVAIPNLRTSRVPLPSWQVRAGELEATVRPGKREAGNLLSVTWRLDIDLNIPAKSWGLHSISTNTPGVRIVTAEPDPQRRAGRRHITVEVTASRMVPTEPDRVPVTLLARYQLGNRTRTQEIEVDYQTTLGDFIDTNSPSHSIARVVERHLHDPVIDNLAERAKSIPRGSLEEEVERLKSMLDYDRDSYHTRKPGRTPNAYQTDPHDEAPGWATGTAYVQSPTETSRYGGDCDDWAVFSASYLTRRGFRVWVASTPAHAWAFAVDKDGRIMNVDLTKENPVRAPEDALEGTLGQQAYEDLKAGMTTSFVAPIQANPIPRERQSK